MFKLFKRGYKYYRAMQINPPQTILYVLEQYQNDIDSIMTFYNSRENWVSNKHILSRMIRTMKLDTDLPLIEYIISLDRRVGWVSRHYNLASPVSHGKFHDNDFYIQQELYDDYFSLDDWRKLTPLYPIHTDYHGLRLSHPQDMLYTYSFQYLDLKALAIQYYHWVHEQLEHNRITDVEVFVAQYPLSNTIPLYANLSIIQLGFKGISIKYPNTHSVHLYNRTKEFAYVFKKFRKYAKNKPIFMDSYLKSIPILGEQTALEYVRVNLPMFNSYNFLPYFFIYGKYIKAMNNVVGKRFITANKNQLSDLHLMLKYYRSTKSFTLDLEHIDYEKQIIYDYLVRVTEKE